MINLDYTPSQIAQLFKARREELRLTQTELADQTTKRLPAGDKLTQQSYAAFEKGKSQTSRHAPTIATVLGVLPEYLALTGGSITPGVNPHREPEATLIGPVSVWDDDTPLDDDEVEVPLLKEVELSAGSGRTAIQEFSSAKLRFGKYTLRRQGVQPESAVCVSVYGNSMEPVLPHGSTVGVDRSKTSVKDGDIYALSHNGHLRVKMLYRLPTGGIRMRSFNQAEHPDEEYSQEDMVTQTIEVIGRVFWYSVLR
ncbi:XRE family transcriptional regulator [Aquipseudomonas alcaligenes]|uniref:HTH cro/C1-type domain-containing protein n=2 Tax=Aquipseudomonas alcaligenes TaxID=43263 RepID=U2Z4I6_AQUA1|nr:helix-turn-helix transcriptional regulator [Pseudomonas alcaligenes]MDH1055285.1 helix-turn-helix transcriptional regulator [Pseudomonas alcaligenes]GAD62671.1 hypothetical protein PA6_014_00440 [Pseudomonas alcaligenes NBRC 14159]SUD18237.1 transcriptional regulator [Pseudomonas alcaligenes]